MNPLIAAIPVFLALAVLEAAAASRRMGTQYKLGDLVSGLGCGTLDQVVNLAVGAGFLVVYSFLSRHAAILDLPSHSLVTWIAAVLLHDLAYYLFHRASHRVNILWAAHAVHHQSEDYTFAVSLRQGAIATWVSYLFYLPLAILDVPVEVFVVVHGVYQVYQFLVHTRFIPGLGPLEHVLATPVLHRVHHGRDAEFLDKNYGGFFIIWDKLFRSFAPYTREPDYGVTAGISSWSPFWANLHPYAELARRARRAPSRRDALALWLRPPEWRPSWWDGTDVRMRGYGPPVARAVAVYALVQLGAATGAAVALLWPRLVTTGAVRFALVALVLSSLATVAAYWDDRAWARRAEAFRLGAIAGGAAALALAGAITTDAAAMVVAGCLLSGPSFAATRSATRADAAPTSADDLHAGRQVEDHELQRLLLR
jgi:sterol desaturase/sphingolipid hydroxylase (fatty acid hydroxylase superfamily)